MSIYAFQFQRMSGYGIIFLLMIRKCCQNIMKTVTPSLTSQSGVMTHLSQPFAQQKQILNGKGSKLDEVISLKTSAFAASDLNPIKIESLEDSEVEGFESNNGRIHGFKGEQRSYFILIAGLLLSFNVAARLTMKHEQGYNSYGKQN